MWKKFLKYVKKEKEDTRFFKDIKKFKIVREKDGCIMRHYDVETLLDTGEKFEFYVLVMKQDVTKKEVVNKAILDTANEVYTLKYRRTNV